MFSFYVGDETILNDVSSNVKGTNFKSIESSVESCLRSSIESNINLVSYANTSALQTLVYSDTLSCLDSIPRDNIRDISVSKHEYGLYDENLLFSLEYNIYDNNNIPNEKQIYINFPREKSFEVAKDNLDMELYSTNEVAFLSLTGNSLSGDGEIDITFLAYETKEFENEDKIIGNYIYEFGPDGLTFNEPVELRINLDVEDLKALTIEKCGGTLCESIYKDVAIVAIENGEIVEYYSTEIDTVNNQAVANITHFSVYGAVKRGNCNPCSWCMFGYKQYDGTWRIRFPSGAPGPSTINVDGNTFKFRSWDKECGCNRPTYTGSYSSSKFGGTHKITGDGIDFSLSTGWGACAISGSSTSSSDSNSGSGSSGTCTYSGSRPSSPANCDTIDHNTGLPCPSGTVNCDGEKGCGSTTSCSLCPVECP